MNGARRVRRFLSGMLALAVVVGVAYGAAALLSPLPQLVVEQTLTVAVDSSWGAQLPLPDAGSTAVVAESGSAVVSGSVEPRPIAGAAKLVLAHVVLAAEPLTVGATGAVITIGQEAIDRYRELDAAGARTVDVQFGQTWTRRDLLAATLIGSGNNTAELLIDAVFAGPDAYLAAARTWLDEQGLVTTTVVDGTGLDAASLSTAAELASLARLTLDNPVLAGLFTDRPRETSAGVDFGDGADFLSGQQTLGLSRSYSDEAGVCVVFAVPAGDELIVVAMVGQPSYPSAESAATALIASIREAVRDVNVVTAGQVVAVARSAWGQSTDIVAVNGITVSSTEIEDLEVRLDAAARSTIVRGTDAGSVTVTTGTVEQVARLEATSAITEPGVAWRFADPATVIQRWTGS